MFIKINKTTNVNHVGKNLDSCIISKYTSKLLMKDKKDHKCGPLAHLKRHMKTVHERQKDPLCETCGKDFVLIWDHKKHIKTVHYAKRFLYTSFWRMFNAHRI